MTITQPRMCNGSAGKLFVYGSLQPGGANAHVLEPYGGSWRPASVKGHLQQRGWGAELGYPGLFLDENGPRVSGYLLTSPKIDSAWRDLDAFEGAEYARVSAAVELDEGDTVFAFVYVLKEATPRGAT